ncbi:MAG TPA: PRC-barrel domain-containing protein [Terriglobales bacterium]|nr:PRC-barrel domain-containing protein [Terriglobales bacterium]
MAHYGTLHDYRFSDPGGEDIRGSKIYGRDDDKLGKIDDVIFDHTTGAIAYVVVDTGGWLSSKRFIVPSERLRRSTKHEEDFQVDLDKKQIESFPPYDEKAVQSQDRWKDYEKQYSEAWKANPVQHLEGTDRNITPPATQMPQRGTAAGTREPSTSPSLGDESGRITPATANEVRISNSAVGLGGRWSTFEDRLRQRRKEITSSCQYCSSGATSERYPESDVSERKVS